MTTFPSMPDVLPAGKLGLATVSHFEVTPTNARFTSFRAIVTGRDEYIPPGRYARLHVGSTLMMTDTPMERRSNLEVIRRARGHVLVAGLGLGMILHPILKTPEVTRVTVVEKYGDVIRLVGPSLPQEKLELVEADIFTWAPEKGTRFDVLYFDIWPTITLDNLPEMATLHRRGARWKAPGAWMGSWKHKELQARRDREKRSGRAFY